MRYFSPVLRQFKERGVTKTAVALTVALTTFAASGALIPVIEQPIASAAIPPPDYNPEGFTHIYPGQVEDGKWVKHEPWVSEVECRDENNPNCGQPQAYWPYPDMKFVGGKFTKPIKQINLYPYGSEPGADYGKFVAHVDIKPGKDFILSEEIAKGPDAEAFKAWVKSQSEVPHIAGRYNDLYRVFFFSENQPLASPTHAYVTRQAIFIKKASYSSSDYGGCRSVFANKGAKFSIDPEYGLKTSASDVEKWTKGKVDAPLSASKFNTSNGHWDITVPADTKPGVFYVRSTVKFKGQDPQDMEVCVNVENYADYFGSRYSDMVVPAGSTTAQAPSPAEINGKSVIASYEKLEGPEWAPIDTKNGKVTASPSLAKELRGEHRERVKVTYTDGSVHTEWFTITVTEPRKTKADRNDPQYVTTKVTQNETAKVAPPTGVDPADVASYEEGEHWQDWAKLDHKTGAITLKPGWDVPATFTALPVVVKYKDEEGSQDYAKGGQDIAWAPIIVEPGKLAGRYDPKMPDLTRVKQNETATIPAPTPLPEGTVCSLRKGAPAWATINPDNSVTLNPTWTDPKLDGKNSKIVTIPVRCVYKDGSSDDLDPRAEVLPGSDADRYDPSYDEIAVTQGKTAKSGKPKSKDPLPKGTKYAIDPGASPIPATVDPNTGIVTVAPGYKSPTGSVKVPVMVTYPDKSTDTIPLPAVVSKGKMKDEFDPRYKDGMEVTQGDETTIPAPTPLPDGATCKPGKGVPSYATVNTDCSITVAPGFDVKPGKKKFPVTITYPDGSVDEGVVATVTVLKGKDSDHYGPSYDDVSVPQGGEVRSDRPVGEYPESTTFTVHDSPFEASIDENTGIVTVKVDEGARTGRTVVPVTAHYEDGTTDEVPLHVTVTKVSMADSLDPQYDGPVEVHKGEEATSTKPHPLPDGSTCTPGEGVPSYVEVRPDCTFVAKPSHDAEEGHKVVPVKVTFPDGSKKTITGGVNVLPDKDADHYNPNYGDNNHVTQGQHKVIAPPKDIPKGTVCEAAGDLEPWQTVNKDCSITVAPGYDVEPGERKVPVKVTFPDGSSKIITAPVTVDKALDKDQYDPQYEPVSVQQNREATAPRPTDLPEKAVCEPGVDIPAWAEIHPDCSVTVKPGFDVEPGPYPINVPIVYPDGSREDAVLGVVVTKGADAESHTPVWPEIPPTIPGETRDVPPPTGVPGGTKFARCEDTPEWVDVHEDGSLHIHPGLFVEEGDYSVPICVTYPDGSTQKTHVNVPIGSAFKNPWVIGAGVIGGLGLLGAILAGSGSADGLSSQAESASAPKPAPAGDDVVHPAPHAPNQNGNGDKGLEKPQFLARTGANVSWMAALAMLVLLTGAGMTLWSRRRRTS